MTATRIAMIGAGGFARRHLEVLSSRPDVDVVGHAARRFEAAHAQAQRFGGNAFDTVDAMLDTCRPAAVWIVLPPGAHGPPEDACIARGIPFFVEKPLSAGREPAERIATALARSGVTAAVGYHWRALDVLADARAALDGRRLRLVRGSWHSSTPSPPWWTKHAESGGQMVEQATHVLDIARVLVGDADVIAALAPQIERAEWPASDVPPASAALLRYRSGPIGVFSATCALAGPADATLELFAEGRRLVLDQHRLLIDDGRTSHEIKVVADPIETEDRAFLEAVRTGEPERVIASYTDSLASHRLALAIDASANERQGS